MSQFTHPEDRRRRSVPPPDDLKRDVNRAAASILGVADAILTEVPQETRELLRRTVLDALGILEYRVRERQDKADVPASV